MEKEFIPDNDNLLRRISNEMVKNGKVQPLAFDLRPKDRGCLSVNWDKYSSPEETIKQSTDPKYSGCLSINAGSVRKNELSVEHEPSINNRAHSIIFKNGAVSHFGFNKERRLLSQLSKIIINPVDY